jgi:hypothetical protein
MDAGGNDIWFGSEESSRKPQLIVETVDGGASLLALTPQAVTALPEPLRIRCTWLTSTELELGWELVEDADYEIQVRTSATDGVWTTIHRATSAPGTVTFPVVIDSDSTTAFFRVVQLNRDQRPGSDLRF